MKAKKAAMSTSNWNPANRKDNGNLGYLEADNGSNGLVNGTEDYKKDSEEEDELVDLLSEDEDDLVDLPGELSSLNNQTFKCQADLEFEVVKRGFPDLFVVLNSKGKPRLRMTSGAHKMVVGEYTQEFNGQWGKDRWGAAGGDGTNVFIRRGKAHRRMPDIAFWGYKKCELNERRVLSPKKVPNPPKIFRKTREQAEYFHPDVVFQFSWGNDEGYEIDAINEMMNKALLVAPQPENEPPRLGFLLKMRTHPNKRTHDDRKILQQLDVHRVPRGTTFDDAKNNRNGASCSSYSPGQQDVILEITSQDLGIEGFWAFFCAVSFKISAKGIFDMLV